MDLMAIRRGLMMGKPQSVIDTSPIILQYDAKYNALGNIVLDSYGYCITVKYSYPVMQSQGTIAYNGTGGQLMLVYKDNGETKLDYWTLYEANSPRKCVNVGSDAMSFTLETSKLDDSYAYIVDTGQILFAGRNTIYYGHQNISELS